LAVAAAFQKSVVTLSRISAGSRKASFLEVSRPGAVGGAHDERPFEKPDPAARG
jgi:hypothetical protein